MSANTPVKEHMTSPIKLLADRGLVRLWKENVVGEIDSIPLVSLSDSHHDFIRIIKRSIELIRHFDRRRYERVIRYTDWLVDDALYGGAYTSEYKQRTKSIQIDFEYDNSKGGMYVHAAYYAGTIVYLATHGKMHALGIRSKASNRLRKARICQAEMNRFLERMLEIFPELPSSMIQPINPDDYRKLGILNRSWKLIARMIGKK
ncbi:hypothetical protein N9A94_06950 [Akkermansiaceae bacterium]|nr:hypothetical protein [Akkermansiaceae bacterium]MDA7888922.1 hypothetical protein [Akkermansiaceae bacterium]